MRTGLFPSTQHTELNTLKEPFTLKGKCAVNAEKFICNLLTVPLIKMILKVSGQCFKRDLSNDVYVAKYALVFMRQSVATRKRTLNVVFAIVVFAADQYRICL